MLPFVLADLDDRNDSRVIELCRRFGFGVKSLHVFFTSKLTGKDHFERDDPIEIRLPGFVDDAHPATRDLFQQFVIAEITDLLADRWAGHR